MTTRWARILLAVVVAFIMIGCGSEQDRQWFKPDGNYTVAEFKRDRDECTKDKVLDEACLKQRGWVPVTSDPSAPTKAKAPTYRR
jgi:hypothetical protein